MPDLGDTKVATFYPRDSKTLKPEATAWVMWRGTWRYLWTHEEGRYKGQAVWEPADRSIHFGWVPDEDLQDGEL